MWHTIGRGLPRVEGASKVEGTCVYTADVIRPSALWGKFLRSPLPHARILSIDVSQALRLPGVKAIVTGKDISPRLEGYTLQDKPVFALDRVRYIGEKVAGVAAIDKDIAEEALTLIDVNYEELPTVFDPVEALKPEAPLLHPKYASYLGPPNMAPQLRNVQTVISTSKGDIAAGFAESDRVFENTFRTHMVHQGFIEPRACVVEIDKDGRIMVWFGHQSSFKVRSWLATHIGIAEERIVVHPVNLGGSFGGKEGYEDALCTYYLAKASGRPVKVVSTYTDELIDGEPRHAAVITLRTGIKNDGRLWAWDGKIHYDGGAYAARKPSPRANMNGTFMLAGSYSIPHTKMEGYAVYTNRIPCGYFRAPGEVQTLFAVESHMDMIAETMGIDPLEFRLRNALKGGDTRSTGESISDPRAQETLQQVAKSSNWNGHVRGKKNGQKLAGRGWAFGDRHVGHGESSTELFLEKDGTLCLTTSVRDQGVGAYTMHRQVAAEVLGINPNLIRVEIKGTDTGPYDEGVRGARGTHVEGQAVFRAAQALIKRLCEESASLWKVRPEKVEWKDGKAGLSKGKSRETMGLKGIARNCDVPICGFGHFKAETKPDVYSFQAIVADVEVDSETGEIDVQKLYFAYDVTQVINPIIHQGQIEGGIIQGLGFTVMEEMAVEEGRILTLNLGDYKIPTIKDIPRLATTLVQADQGPGPFGAKAVAEAGISIIAPAIANAVYDATGVRIIETPITSEKILTGLASRAIS
jgi:CO/xanthine dehydrogenase Mo-binding subunit